MTVIDEIFQYYSNLTDKTRQENIISMLREIQEEEGMISPEIKDRLIKTLGVKESMINIIIKMCPDLKICDYQHTITLCSGARCGAKNGGEILYAIKKHLEPDNNGISKNHTIRIKTQNCLKQCKTSPNMLIDGQLYTNLTVKSALDLIFDLQRKDVKQ